MSWQEGWIVETQEIIFLMGESPLVAEVLKGWCAWEGGKWDVGHLLA